MKEARILTFALVAALGVVIWALSGQSPIEPCARQAAQGALMNQCACDLVQCVRVATGGAECFCDANAKQSGGAWVDLAKLRLGALSLGDYGAEP